jgi:hypothetical protein
MKSLGLKLEDKASMEEIYWKVFETASLQIMKCLPRLCEVSLLNKKTLILIGLKHLNQ